MGIEPEKNLSVEVAYYPESERENLNGGHPADGWDWYWEAIEKKQQNRRKEQEREEDDDNSPTQDHSFFSYTLQEDSDLISESSDGDDKYYEPYDLPLTWVRRHDWQYWDKRTRDPQSGVRRIEIKLFSPNDGAPYYGLYSPSLSTEPAWKADRKYRYWMLDFTHPTEAEGYPPEPVGESPFERFCPVTTTQAMAPALLHVMDYLSQRDVNMVRTASKTLRASWPERIMGTSAYCKMLLPNKNFRMTISGTRDTAKDWDTLETSRKTCGSRSQKYALLPCEGDKFGLGNHGPDHDICDSCHTATQWDMRYAQQYVFGRQKRIPICGSCRIKYGTGEESPNICRCEDNIANARLCWDCRRTLIWKTWRRNRRNEEGPCLINGVPVKGKVFPHCDQTDECEWCVHSQLKKNHGQCNQQFCVHCPPPDKWEREDGYEGPQENGNGENENEPTLVEAVLNEDTKREPDEEDDRQFYDELHDYYNLDALAAEMTLPLCPICRVDIDYLRSLREDNNRGIWFRERHAFLCLGCGGVCGGFC